MIDIAPLLTLFTVHIVALMSPGPDFALVVQNASRFGRNTGVMIALGLSVGILCHATLSLLGVSLLISQHPLLFSAIRFLGGSYLLWLGINALRGCLSQDESPALDEKNQLLQQRRQAFTKGFTTNILNPKALIFFVSLLSSLVPAGMTLGTKLGAISILWLTSFAWFGFLAWLLTGKRMQKIMLSLAPFIDGVCGTLFTLVGGGLVWQTASSLL
uniref:LysE family transporter n=1 Tax=Thaumasiovibrio occultus TaxID=1891184 RepID=UPI000B35686B|nr:LysE family transporter [Thaumasiovibrio occultus]